MIEGMFNRGSLPVLERLTQFTGERHKLLSHNVANLSTPYFKPRDLDVEGFQAQLRDAIDERRTSVRPIGAPLPVRDSQQVRFEEDRLDVRPSETNEGVLFHDQNNRDVERLMQDLAENTMTHRASIELIRNQFSVIGMAIRGRV